MDEFNNSGKRVCIAPFVSADFGRKHNENRAKPFTATLHNVLNCHVNERIFAGGVFGEFRLNGAEVIGNQFNNLIKAGHNVGAALVAALPLNGHQLRFANACVAA
jgi:hypothetical protein